MARSRAVLFAAAAMACAFVSPAVAGVFAFDVYEGTVTGDNQYILENNTADSYVTQFIVTNPAPESASANRANWGADIFPSISVESIDDVPAGCNGPYFGGESGFCYFDWGSEGFNWIAPGESQIFFFNGPRASDYALIFQDATGAIFDCRGVTNVKGCGAIETSGIPEPATLGFMGGALGLLGLFRRRKMPASA